MIKLNDVSFKYGNNTVLSDISLDFEIPKLYGIIGPNGSGKTTLLNIISRQLKMQSGELLFDNIPYDAFSRNEFAKKVAFLPQHLTKSQMTVRDFVSFGRFPHLGLSKKLSQNDENIVDEHLYLTDTAHLSQKQMCNLSGGEQQRAHIAMVLSQDTPYIMLDEPTSFLDVSSKFDLFKKLNIIKNKQKCIITVIHDIALALRFCDSIILLNNGKLVKAGTPDDIISDNCLDDVFNITCKKISIGKKTEYIICPKEVDA